MKCLCVQQMLSEMVQIHENCRLSHMPADYQIDVAVHCCYQGFFDLIHQSMQQYLHMSFLSAKLNAITVILADMEIESQHVTTVETQSVNLSEWHDQLKVWKQ